MATSCYTLTVKTITALIKP